MFKRSAAQLAGVTSEHVFERNVEDVENQLGYLKAPPHFFFHLVPSRLQDSVTCGLVALCMAADW
jgi:hypothetical protein